MPDKLTQRNVVFAIYCEAHGIGCLVDVILFEHFSPLYTCDSGQAASSSVLGDPFSWNPKLFCNWDEFVV